MRRDATYSPPSPCVQHKGPGRLVRQNIGSRYQTLDERFRVTAPSNPSSTDVQPRWAKSQPTNRSTRECVQVGGGRANAAGAATRSSSETCFCCLNFLLREARPAHNRQHPCTHTTLPVLHLTRTRRNSPKTCCLRADRPIREMRLCRTFITLDELNRAARTHIYPGEPTHQAACTSRR